MEGGVGSGSLGVSEGGRDDGGDREGKRARLMPLPLIAVVKKPRGNSIGKSAPPPPLLLLSAGAAAKDSCAIAAAAPVPRTERRRQRTHTRRRCGTERRMLRFQVIPCQHSKLAHTQYQSPLPPRQHAQPGLSQQACAMPSPLPSCQHSKPCDAAGPPCLRHCPSCQHSKPCDAALSHAFTAPLLSTCPAHAPQIRKEGVRRIITGGRRTCNEASPARKQRCVPTFPKLGQTLPRNVWTPARPPRARRRASTRAQAREPARAPSRRLAPREPLLSDLVSSPSALVPSTMRPLTPVVLGVATMSAPHFAPPGPKPGRLVRPCLLRRRLTHCHCRDYSNSNRPDRLSCCSHHRRLSCRANRHRDNGCRRHRHRRRPSSRPNLRRRRWSPSART